MTDEILNKYNQESGAIDYSKLQLSDMEEELNKLEKDNTSNPEPYNIPDDQTSVLIDVPQQAYYGFKDALNAASNFAGNFVYEKMTGEKYEGNISEDIYGEKGKPAKTTAGTIVRPISQAVTGFGLGGGVTKLVGLTKAAEGSAFLAKALPFIKGFTGDFIAFDEHEKNLTDTLNDVGLKDNPIVKTMSAYLKHEGDDTEVEARLKNSLEGAFVGGVADGIFKGVKYIKNGRIYKNFAKESSDKINKGINKSKEILKSLNEKPKNLDEKISEMVISAERNKTVISIEEQKKQAEDLFNQKYRIANDLAEENIESESIKKVLSELENSDEGKKLTIATIAESNSYKNTINTIKSSLDNLSVTGDDNAINQGLEAVFSHLDVDNKVKDVFSSTMRSAGLRAKERAVLNSNRLKAILGDASSMTKKQLLETMAKLDSPDDANALLNNIDKAFTMSKGQAWSKFAKHIYMNGLLSSVKSFAADTISTVLWQPINVLEKIPASAIGKIRRGIFHSKKDYVDIKEAGVMMGVHIETVKDMMTSIAKGFHESYQSKSLAPILNQTKDTLNKISLDVGDKWGEGVDKDKVFLNPEFLGLNPESLLGQTVNFIKKYDSYSPLSLLSKKDDVIAGSTYRANVKALAYRRAAMEEETGEKIFKNKEEKLARINFLEKNTLALDSTKSDLVDFANNSLSIDKNDLAIMKSMGSKALSETEKALFRDESGAITVAAQRLINSIPGGFLVVPFLKTPVKIAVDRVFMERGIGALISPKFYKAIRKGGAEADMAIGQFATGMSLQMLGYNLALSGRVTGTAPTKKGQRDSYLAAGIRPNSILINGEYVDISRYAPFANFLTVPATMLSMSQQFEDKLDDDDKKSMIELMEVNALATATMLKDSSWLKNFSEFVEIVTDSATTPERLNKFLENTAVSFIPAILSDPKDLFNMQEYQQYSTNILEKIQNKVGMDTRPALDIFGKPIERAENWYGIVPAMTSEAKINDPVIKEMMATDTYFSKPTNVFQALSSETKLTQSELYDYNKWIGDVGTKEALEKLIKSKSYKMGDNYAKQYSLKKVYESKLQEAKYKFLAETPEVKARLEKELNKKYKELPTIPSVNKPFIGE